MTTEELILEKKKNVRNTLRLVKDISFADEVTDSAKEYMRNEIDIALKELDELVELKKQM